MAPFALKNGLFLKAVTVGANKAIRIMSDKVIAFNHRLVEKPQNEIVSHLIENLQGHSRQRWRS